MDTDKHVLDVESQTSTHISEFGIKLYLRGDGKYSSKKWNLLCCGGLDAVLVQLRAYKQKYSIGLSVEKFDW